MPRPASGKVVIRLLVKHFSFTVTSQKGSHVKLRKYTVQGTITTIVPLHSELARGTLRGVLKLAQINYEDFKKYL